jgi:hypothetical protein
LVQVLPWLHLLCPCASSSELLHVWCSVPSPLMRLTCSLLLVVASYVGLACIVVRNVWWKVLLCGSVNVWSIPTVSNLFFVRTSTLIGTVVWDNACPGLDKTMVHKKAWGGEHCSWASTCERGVHQWPGLYTPENGWGTTPLSSPRSSIRSCKGNPNSLSEQLSLKI